MILWRAARHNSLGKVMNSPKPRVIKSNITRPSPFHLSDNLQWDRNSSKDFPSFSPVVVGVPNTAWTCSRVFNLPKSLPLPATIAAQPPTGRMLSAINKQEYRITRPLEFQDLR